MSPLLLPIFGGGARAAQSIGSQQMEGIRWEEEGHQETHIKGETDRGRETDRERQRQRETERETCMGAPCGSAPEVLSFISDHIPLARFAAMETTATEKLVYCSQFLRGGSRRAM